MVVTVVVVIAKVRSRQKCLDRYLVCPTQQPDGGMVVVVGPGRFLLRRGVFCILGQ